MRLDKEFLKKSRHIILNINNKTRNACSCISAIIFRNIACKLVYFGIFMLQSNQQYSTMISKTFFWLIYKEI